LNCQPRAYESPALPLSYVARMTTPGKGVFVFV
jgi:hypothetical protein